MQRLIYNLTGQTLTHIPDTRRATATWRLEDLLRDIDDSARLLDDGSVSVDAATEAITAEAGPTETNPRRVTVASTTGFVVGHWYEIVSATAGGDLERVKLAGIETNAALTFEHPLIGTYPSSSTVQGVELVTAAIDAAVVQLERRVQQDEPMRIVWTYPDGYRYQEAVRLVRDSSDDRTITAIVDDVRGMFPDIDTRMQRHGRDTLIPHARMVIRQIRTDLLTRKLVAENYLAGDKAHWVTVWRLLWHLARLGNAPSTGDAGVGVSANDWAAYCKGEYERYWHALTAGEGGPETIVTDPVSVTSPSSTDTTYRRVIMEL